MADPADNSPIGQIKFQLEMEGQKEGSVSYERRFNRLRVLKCREMRGHTLCQECDYQDHCELFAKVKREYLGIENPDPGEEQDPNLK